MATVHKTQLSLKRKVEIAQDLSKGMTQLDAVKKYKASKGTVSRIGKEKERWVAINFGTLDSAPRKGTERKRIVKVKTIDLDDKLVEYIVRARDLNAIVTGPIIQNIATMISKKLPNLDGFSASNGWLERFRSRNRIVSRALQGERASVPMNAVEEFKKILPTLLKGYDKKDVLNGDEVGLYWEQSGKRTLLQQGTYPAGSKVSKKRITVFIVAAMEGHMEQMIVINQYLKPRAFSRIHYDTNKLPVCMQWKATPKGWMNSTIFKEWLLYLNTTIETQKWNVLLFLDNFSGHECGFELAKEHLTHVRVEWLPPNCTSLLQPVDQGIGNALKIRYRKYLHEHMSKMIFIDKHPMEGVDMLRACVWLGRVWNSLHNTSTVSRCFEKAGFRFESDNEIIPDLISDVVNHDEQDILDQEVLIAGPPAVVDADQVLEMIELFDAKEDQVGNAEEQDDSGAKPEIETNEEQVDLELGSRPISTKEAMLRLSELEKYLEHKGMDDEVAWLSQFKTKHSGTEGGSR